MSLSRIRRLAIAPLVLVAVTGALAQTKEHIRLMVQTGSAAVNSVAFSPDGRRVLTGSWDGAARLWDASSGAELASLVSFTDGGWAVTDPQGRWDASDPNNTPGIYWVTDRLRIIDLQQLKKRYYLPGLLAAVMKGDRLQRHSSGLQPYNEHLEFRILHFRLSFSPTADSE